MGGLVRSFGVFLGFSVGKKPGVPSRNWILNEDSYFLLKMGKTIWPAMLVRLPEGRFHLDDSIP